MIRLNAWRRKLSSSSQPENRRSPSVLAAWAGDDRVKTRFWRWKHFAWRSNAAFCSVQRTLRVWQPVATTFSLCHMRPIACSSHVSLPPFITAAREQPLPVCAPVFRQSRFRLGSTNPSGACALLPPAQDRHPCYDATQRRIVWSASLLQREMTSSERVLLR